ncbi:ArgE/DapE family deacylase [Furfurilactobacillus curtus]|uniref:Probable succinyl-diaminopimelate desuccinylase n=1 Tax=Furfurilactobacillus curtus TaxID=1746200 RepID=A0ABQ5JNX7_9LACO
MEAAEQINLLAELVKIDSRNGHEEAVADKIIEVLAAHGLNAKKIPYQDGRVNLFVSLKGPQPGKTIMLTGHLDTVAANASDGWQADPLSAQITDGKMFGRGTADMKSGLAAMVTTLIELHDAGLPKRGQLQFLATVGEEYGAPGSRMLTEAGYVDHVDAMIVGEPTSDQIIFAHNGSIDYAVDADGKSVHSSMPEKGINAISALNAFINAEAHAFDDVPVSDVLGPVVHSVTVISGGDQVNSIPGHAHLEGNIRPIPDFDNHKVITRLQSVVDQLNQDPLINLHLTIDFSFFPVISDQQSSLVELAKTAVTAITGQPAKLNVIHGATDASEYTKADHHFPIIVLGPGRWEAAHQVNESVDLSDYLHLGLIYQKIVTDFLV